MERITEASPRVKARIAGVLYLITVAAGVVAQVFISGTLVVDADAAATASNILGRPTLFQLGLALYLVEMVCTVAMTPFFYALLTPVSRDMSLLMAFFNLTGAAIKTFSRLFYIAPLLVLGDAAYLRVFTVEQLQALALLFLKVNAAGAGIALVFLGATAFVQGVLILRSTFLPGVLGVFGVVGGLGWLTFLYPPLGQQLFPFVATFGIVGAAALIVWLLVFGVNEQRWNEQAGAAGARLGSGIWSNTTTHTTIDSVRATDLMTTVGVPQEFFGRRYRALSRADGRGCAE